MFRRKNAEPAVGPQVVAALPNGHDDEESAFFVPPELREQYTRVEVTLQDVDRAERALIRQLTYDDAVARQRPVVDDAIERANAAGDHARATVLRQRFYGGGFGRLERIGDSAVQQAIPTHDFRPVTEFLTLGLRWPPDRLLSPADRERAAHDARLTVAAAARKRQLKADEVNRLMTCQVCHIRSDVRRRTIRVAGASPISKRCCSLCESSLTLALRQRVARQTLPSGQTRAQAAQEALDNLGV